MKEVLTLEFDGGSRGNPGPAGIGVVVRAADGTPLVTLGRYIGRATNNVAEYTALVTSMEEAKKLGATKIRINGDSELVIRQMTGQYKVKHPDLIPLYRKAKELFDSFESAAIGHNYREHNELADQLGNLAMDRRKDVTELPGGGGAGSGKTEPFEQDLPSPDAPKAGERVTCGRCGCVVEIVTPSSLRPHQLKDFVCQCGRKMDRA
ncbi:MAG TPA: ribonuclease HI family protein [Tepidisphaeraceae bacterium]|nr:ribonuclease HI family protein [Tepidisphaeraceae bacterium]